MNRIISPFVSLLFILSFNFNSFSQVCFEKQLTLKGEEYLDCHPSAYWMSPVDAAAAPGTGNFQTFVGLLTTDTGLVLVNGKSEREPQTTHSVGIVFDAADENFELVDDGLRQHRWDPLHIDSIAFSYVYVRHVDSTEIDSVRMAVVDTMIVQLFRRAHLRLGQFTNQQGKTELFAQPQNFDPKSLLYNTAAYTYKIPLTAKDSTGIPKNGKWESKVKILAVPRSIGYDIPPPLPNSGNLFGFSLTFKSILQAQPGDTLEAFNGDSVVSRLNYLGYSHVTNDATPTAQEKNYNNAVFTDSKQRHGHVTNGWKSNIPGNAYFTNRYWRAFISTWFVGISEAELRNKSIKKVYPVPATTDINVELDLEKAQPVQLSLLETTGRLVTKTDLSELNGQELVSMNLERVPQGLYLLQIQIGESSSVRKILVD